MLKMHRLELDWHIKRLKSKQYYFFVRYGDGEWRALTRHSGTTRGHGKYKLSPQSKKAMNKALAKYYSGENLFFGCQASMIDRMNQQPRAWLARHKLLKIKWTYGDVFHDASKQGNLFPLIAELRKHQVVVIGPSFLRQLPEGLFNFIHFIEIPKKAGWLLPSTFERVLACKKKFGDGILYSFSAGIGTNILIPLLYEKMSRNFLIDFGSLWDIFCGERTRIYMGLIRYPKSRIRENLGIS